MEKSLFFDAVLNKGTGKYDRVYLAQDFADYFNKFIGNGVFPNGSDNLQVFASGDGLSIEVRPGVAWINGYMYILKESKPLALDRPSGSFDRFDRVVLRMSKSTRDIHLDIIKGVAGVQPGKPALTRNADVYEICLADINVEAGLIDLTQAQIKDTRHDKELCGIVSGLINQVDTTTLFNQYESWFEESTAEAEKEFLEWFESVKDILDGDVATKLYNEIQRVESNAVASVNGETGKDITLHMYHIPGLSTIIGDIEEKIKALSEDVGDKRRLVTNDRRTIVNAINEVKDETRELFQSGVERNKQAVDILNSKNIEASTGDSLKINIDKFKDVMGPGTKINRDSYRKVLSNKIKKSNWLDIGRIKGLDYFGHFQNVGQRYLAATWTDNKVSVYSFDVPAWSTSISVEAAALTLNGLVVADGSNLRRYYLNGTGGTSVTSLTTRGKMVCMDEFIKTGKTSHVTWSAEREIGLIKRISDANYSKMWSKNVAEVQTVCEGRFDIMTVADEAGRVWFIDERGVENSNKLQLGSKVEAVYSVMKRDGTTRVYISYGSNLGMFEYDSRHIKNSPSNTIINIDHLIDRRFDRPIVSIQLMEDDRLIAANEVGDVYTLDSDTLQVLETRLSGSTSKIVPARGGATGYEGIGGDIAYFNGVRFEQGGRFTSLYKVDTGSIELK